METVTVPLTIADAATQLRDGTTDCEALTAACLASIRRLEPHLHAFISVTEDLALSTARALDKEFNAGRDRGALHGIPIVYKDNYDTAGVLTTIGSALYRNRIPSEDAPVVRLLKAAGTVMLGKTNMNEFAAGGPGGFNAFYGNTRNPWDIDREPGGSSSGTAAAVASGLCLGGFGTDTGGSIRGPASRCGIVGLRPTFDRVSVAGVFPRGYSMDVCGPLAHSVADAALLFNAMTGNSVRTFTDRATEDFTTDLDAGIAGLRLGVIDNFTSDEIDEEIADAMHAAVGEFAGLGADVRSINISLLGGDPGLSHPLTVLLYEFNQILKDAYCAAPDPERKFGPIVRRDIETGMRISQKDYQQALGARSALAAQMRAAFSQIDALLTPTMPTVAPLLTQPDLSGRHRRFTIPFSFVGLPAISVPCGFSVAGLPIGLQIVCNAMREGLLLRIAAAYQSVTDFHLRRPALAFASPGDAEGHRPSITLWPGRNPGE